MGVGEQVNLDLALVLSELLSSQSVYSFGECLTMGGTRVRLGVGGGWRGGTRAGDVCSVLNAIW